jgi:hypothetical protein
VAVIGRSQQGVVRPGRLKIGVFGRWVVERHWKSSSNLVGRNVPEARHIDDEPLPVVLVIVATVGKPGVFASAGIEGSQLELPPVGLPGVLGAIPPLRIQD